MCFAPQLRRSAIAVYASLLIQFAAMTALVIFEAVRGGWLAEQVTALSDDLGSLTGRDGAPGSLGARGGALGFPPVHGDALDSPAAQAVMGAAGLFAVLLMLLIGATLAAGWCYLLWLVRAAQMCDLSGRAVGRVLTAWLVPGVNLIAPPLVADRVRRDAGPPPGPRWRALLWGWWLSSLAALALVLLPAGDTAGLTGLGLPELTATAVAAALCIATVHTITRLHTHPAPPQPPPSPGRSRPREERVSAHRAGRRRFSPTL